MIPSSHIKYIIALLLLLVISFSKAKQKAIKIIHPHDEIIHGWFVDDMAGKKLDDGGEKDVSGLLNKALTKLFKDGGGNLYLPAGKYRIDQPIYIPPGCAIRGDFEKPGKGAVDPSKNTIICAYYGRDMDEQADPLFFVDGSALIDGFTIWYPEQNIGNVVPYAPSIRHDNENAKWAINGSTRNVFLVNAYTGIQLGKKGSRTCIQLMKNIYGTPLANGIEVWSDADIPRILDLEFSPKYWLSAQLDNNPPNESLLKKYLLENAAGITYHRCDGSELANITINGYHKGLNLLNGIWNDTYNLWIDNEGHYINFNITNCYYAVWIKNIKNHGTQFYNSTLEGIHSAVYVENPTHGKECAMFMGCTLKGGKAAISQNWEDQKNDLFSLMFTACTFNSPIEWTGGNLSVVDCDFEFEGTHVSIGADTKHAIIVDSRFKGTRNIDNQAGENTLIGESTKRYINPPAYKYDANKISIYRPPVNTTIFVESGDGKTDDAKRLQEQIDKLSKQGGGYIFLSAGFYRLGSPLVINKNVELRGGVQAWQHSKFLSYYVEENSPKGAVLFVDYGKDIVNSTVITLEENAGLDGLFFHYPGQEFNSKTKEVESKFSWLIRLKGDHSYVKHVMASNPWRFIDVQTFAPKDTYIGYCNGAPLDRGIHVGEAENCMIDNVHFNSWYWNTVYFPNTIKKTTEQNGFKLELDNWMKANTEAFIFEGSKNVDVYGSFIFCTKSGFTLLPGKNSGQGPSGIIINSSCDWSKYGLMMHANNGLTFANMHFIDVGKNDPDKSISSIFVAEGCLEDNSPMHEEHKKPGIYRSYSFPKMQTP